MHRYIITIVAYEIYLSIAATVVFCVVVI